MFASEHVREVGFEEQESLELPRRLLMLLLMLRRHTDESLHEGDSQGGNADESGRRSSSQVGPGSLQRGPQRVGRRRALLDFGGHQEKKAEYDERRQERGVEEIQV